MDETLSFLDKVDKPFFLHYTPYAVHTPIHKVDSLMNKYTNKPPYKGQKNPNYATMVDNLDRNIGDLIKKLKEKNLFDNSIIILLQTMEVTMVKLQCKNHLELEKEVIMKVELGFLFYSIGKVRLRTGINNTSPISHLDIFPTIMDAIGDHSMDNEFDGNSILNSLINGAEFKERSLFWHFPIYLQGYNIKDNENRDSFLEQDLVQ